MQYFPEKLVIHESIAGAAEVKAVLGNLDRFGQKPEVLIVKKPEDLRGEPVSTLFLLPHVGQWLKPCPGTPEYVCCGYQILNFSTGCPIQCTYCILSGYFQDRAMTYACDHKNLFTSLAQTLDKRKSFSRIGSGEFTDSLVLDHLAGFSAAAVPFFLKRKNVLFEIKTKTDNINNLLEFNGQKKVMVSWSLNPPGIIDAEEKGSAKLAERLDAAEKCMKNGYLLGFHFDPVLLHKGWPENYAGVVDEIYRRIDPEVIAWISLGCFRFVPELKGTIQARYPNTRIIYEEFVRGKDGKMRYFRPIREALYSHILDRIRKHHKNPPVYFCMETPLVWERVMGKKNQRSACLSAFLDGVKDRFRL